MAGRAVHAAGGSPARPGLDDPLAPYVPRLVVDWLHDEPEQIHRSVTGTCVFADISGFTALTERLAAAGKVGAEEMADLLNGAFDELLTAAYDFGASLIKWGGDAVLLHFVGSDHIARAVNGAWSMQSVMRRIGRLQTSRGVVRLGMSIGVHTGDLDLLLVGTEHRELVVTGPTATVTAHMEKIAQRGQVIVSAQTAAALPARCVGVAIDDGFVLKTVPPVALTPNRSVKRSGVDLGAAMCPDLSEHLRGGVVEHEHRFITVGFLQFSGSDELRNEHGADELADAVSYLIESAQQAAADNEVTFLATDVAEDGGKIIFTAGAPQARGDDATRVLATLKRVVHPGGRLDVRAGVTCGSVFAGDYGPFYRRTYSIAGDVVNLAARLAAHARAGQLITTPDVVARSRTHFEIAALPPFQVKGKAQPIEAVVVGEIRRASEPVVRDRLPLVGREEELAVLLETAERAAAGRGGVVDIVGAPGIGKSRLIEELNSRVEMYAMWADGDIYGRATPYQPMQRLFRTTLGLPPDVDRETVAATLHDLVAGTAPDQLPLLPLIGIVAGVDLPSTPEVDLLDPEVRRARLEAVTSEVLGRALPGPLIMIVNDVHFLDEATVGLLRRLAEDAAFRSWLIVTTRRPGAESVIPPAPHVVTIALEPLDERASAELAAIATGSAQLPEHRLRRLAERAGGNPMFLTQLAAAAGDDGSDALPNTVEAVVAAQIDKLPSRRRRWLRTASVLGMIVEQDLLAEVLAGSDLEGDTADGLDEFINLNVDGHLRFSHHLIRLSAYEGLPYRRRIDLHSRIAEILERRLRRRADEQADRLSLHWFEGARFDKAWRYARVAGDRARAIYAPAEAAECYRRALSAASRLPALETDALADVLESLADVYMTLGETDAAERTLRQARRLARTDPPRLARLYLATAEHRQHAGRHADALRWITRGRALLADRADAASRSLLTRLAQAGTRIRYDQGAYRAALVWARRAVDEARAAADPVAEAHAQALSSVVRAAAGVPVDESTMQQAVEILEQVDDRRGSARAANMFGMYAYFAGKWDTAVGYYAQAERITRTLGRDHDAALTSVNRAEVLVQQGRISEAEPVVASAIRVFLGARATSFLGFATTIYARVALARGDHETAMDRLAEARSLCLEMGETDEALTADALVAECLLRSGAPIDALSYAEVALAQVDEIGGEVTAEPALHRVRGEALLVGGWPGGEESLRASLGSARERGATADVELALDALLRYDVAADEAEARAWRDESAELIATLGIVAVRVSS